MEEPDFNKKEIFNRQRELLKEKRDRLNRPKESGYVEENQRLTKLLLADITRDVVSGEVQELVNKLVNLLKAEDCPVMDMKYGSGASEFLGKALQYYFKGDVR